MKNRVIVLILALLFAGCAADDPGLQRDAFAAGDPEQGRQAISNYGCGSCHKIPGISGAHAMVGPPLEEWAERSYIAGSMINTAENLILWIQYPQSVEPGTVMPNLGVTLDDARDIAAYLYTLGTDR